VSDWPALPLEDWKDTYATLHMYSQIVGKVRLALAPRLNHWWSVPLYVDARGLTTSAIPWKGGLFEIRFDFLDHALVIERDDGASPRLALEPRSVADFYREVRRMLRELEIEPKIWRMPVEIPDPIPFDEDRTHAAYDPERAAAFWRVLAAIVPVFEEFRGGFLGKSSPVHFFWGSFDLASTRFSGRRAPERPDADPITREAYSHEVWSAGFWPGGAGVAGPAFYAYAAPEPPAFAAAAVRPAKAFYHPDLKEFLLMYDDVRRAGDPRGTLRAFLDSTYEAAADLGGWDRESLER